jgi:hypothetical protein
MYEKHRLIEVTHREFLTDNPGCTAHTYLDTLVEDGTGSYLHILNLWMEIYDGKRLARFHEEVRDVEDAKEALEGINRIRKVLDLAEDSIKEFTEITLGELLPVKLNPSTF